MNINGSNVNIDDLFNKDYFHIKINDNLYLTKKDIDLLNSCDIDPYSVGSTKDLIFIIEELIEQGEESEDLELLLNQLSEFNYYNNTNK